MVKRIKLLLACLLLTSLSFSFAEPATQKTIVTVVEGKAMCFDLPEELARPGILKIGIFIERINDYSGKAELIGGKRITVYIPYNLRYEIYDKLQPGALVLVQRNYRRIYQTEWDIISVGTLATAGLAYARGELQVVDVKEFAEVADEVKAELKNEEAVTSEEAKAEVVSEVTEAAVVTEAAPGPGAVVNNDTDTRAVGAGPVSDEATAAESADTVTVTPTEPPPPVTTTGPSSNDRYVDGDNGSNDNDGTSWDSAWRTVAYALYNVSGTNIYVRNTCDISDGEQFPLNMKNGVNIIGSPSATINASGWTGTVRTVIVAAGITGVTLQNLTITGGTGVQVGDIDYSGGVTIYNASTITIDSCTITGNSVTSGYGGGGIDIAGGSNVTIRNSTISSNTGSGSSIAGGIHTVSGTATAITLNISDTTINGNSNTNTIGGGAVFVERVAGGATINLNISRCKFISNTSANTTGYDGLGLSGAGGGFTSYITNCLFRNNNYSGSKGYGISTDTNVILYATNCTFVNQNGIGLNFGPNADASSSTVRNCIFANSVTGLEDATSNGAPDSNDPTVLNCFFNNNSGTHAVDDGSYLTTKALVQVKYGSTNEGDSDPKFKNVSSNNYDIQSSSPCVNIGTTTSDSNIDISIDIDKRSRVGNPDIGCYEYTTESGDDPPITGRVYDSVTGETISSPTIAIYQAGTTTALSTTTSNPYTFNVDPGSYYIAVSKDGYGFPSQIVAEAVDGDHGDIFTAVNDPLTIDIPMDPDGWLYIEKTANKKKVSIGEIITYNIKIQNKHWYRAVSNVELVDEIVNGFKYVGGSTYIGSAKQTDPTVSEHKAVFNLGTISANSTTNISYQVRVGMGIPEGRYESAANTRKSTTQARNSNISSVSVEVIEDPLFTKGTIIGKVFNDIDKDGWQDEGEQGIPKVKIYTEYGVAVETDSDGKYHIKDVPAGNHLLKVDMDATFTTDNPYFVKMTEGLLAKVNFGITQRDPSAEFTPKKSGPQDDRFFIVALGEGIVRNLDTSGNIDMVEKDDRYDDGVQVDGRLALYLKGKVKGKYLITASIDTERRPYGRYDTRSLFKNLDPDKYYPVYGDASTVDYSGVDTQDIVYVMIEWDESFARWGSFHTELPVYNRTLSGGIINYKSTGKTEFGDTKTEIKGFGAFSRQKPAHDEFVGTGGSLYYLRHDNVIEGSEKLKVEARDRIGKTTISSIPLLEEKDYEIDYDTGRILLKRPLNSIQQSYTNSIISNDILMGERVYLVVDYEYYSESLSNESYGGRASQWVGDHIRVGGTYVQENKEDIDDYQIYGADTTVKLNKDTEITANYSHSEETQLGSNLSYDGGLSFQEQYDTFSQGQDGDSYSVGGRTKLFNNTDINLTYTKQDPYYSASDSISQQGSEKYIANIASKLTPNLTAGISHITQKYKEEVTAVKTFGEREVNTTTGILDYQKNKWDARLEYQHQESKNPVTDYTYFGTIPLLDNDFIAARAGYQLFNWLHPYIRGQGTLQGEVNNQGTVGADITIYKNTALNLAETVGTQGNSTLLGLTSKITEETDVYANLEVGNHMQLGKFTKTTYGQSSLLGPGSKAYIEQDYSSYRENIVRGNLLGYDKKITDTLALGLTYERSNVENNITVIDRDTASISLVCLNSDWLRKLGSKLEVRNDSGITEKRQWVTENDILCQITESIALSGRGNWGWTEDIDNEEDEAEFYEVGAGFSLRPVTWDRLNLLGKYSYIRNLPPDSQWDFIELTESRRHVYAIEGVYDLFRYLQLVGKFAYRNLDEKVGPRDWTESDTYLYIARSNFHIMNAEPNKPFILRGWDLGVEYRVLANDQIEDEKDGFLVELDKDIGDYLRMGVGYNFTDYDDDLRDEDNWDAKGWFVRVNGKY